jgi:hypothetical protein
MRRRIIAGLIGAASLATTGIAYAGNQPADPSVADTPSAAAPQAGTANDRVRARERKAGPRGGVPRGAVHGNLLVLGEDGGTKTVTFDRGKVTAIDGTSITIERPDGVSVSKAISDQTAFKGKNRDELQPGTGVIVVSDGDTAPRVVAEGARKEAAAKACANLPQAGAGRGPRARLKERVCQRLEKRSAQPDDSFETILS